VIEKKIEPGSAPKLEKVGMPQYEAVGAKLARIGGRFNGECALIPYTFVISTAVSLKARKRG
jgi:hypothetical protein